MELYPAILAGAAAPVAVRAALVPCVREAVVGADAGLGLSPSLAAGGHVHLLRLDPERDVRVLLPERVQVLQVASAKHRHDQLAEVVAGHGLAACVHGPHPQLHELGGEQLGRGVVGQEGLDELQLARQRLLRGLVHVRW